MGPRKSVLLVDSDARCLRALEVGLRKAGLRVLTAESTHDALELALRTPPDVMVTDSQLPDDDGFKLAQRLKSDPVTERTGVIFLSANDSAEEEIRAINAGSDFYLKKPVLVRDLLDRINELLERQRTEAALAANDNAGNLSGTLANMGVVDLLQLMESGRRTGIADLSTDPRQSGGFVSGGDRRGTLYFRDGRVVDARLAHMPPIEAIYRMLLWEDGIFELEFRPIERADVIQTSTQSILLEGMRRVDEWTKLTVRVPPLATRLTLDLDALTGALPVVPDDMQSVLQLFDGRRTVLEVIDDAPMLDLDALALVADLHAHGTLVATPENASKDAERSAAWAPAEGPMLEPALVAVTRTSDVISALHVVPGPVGGISAGQGLENPPPLAATTGIGEDASTIADLMPRPLPAPTMPNTSDPPSSDTVPGNVAPTMPVQVVLQKPTPDPALATSAPDDVDDGRHDFFSSDRDREVEVDGALGGPRWRRMLPGIATAVAALAAGFVLLLGGVFTGETPRPDRDFDPDRPSGPSGPIAERPTDERSREAEKLVEIGRRHLREKNVRLARSSFDSALQADPDNAAAHAELSMVWVRLEEDRKARAAAWRALKLDREQARAHLALAIVYANAGDQEKAKRYYRSFLRYEKTGKLADEVRRILANLP